MEVVGIVIVFIIGAIIGPKIYNIIVGQIRMRRLATRYGLPPHVILDQYILFMNLNSATGLPPTLRAFEIVLRQDLASFNPEVRLIEPLYCKGLDPLNPYIKE